MVDTLVNKTSVKQKSPPWIKRKRSEPCFLFDEKTDKFPLPREPRHTRAFSDSDNTAPNTTDVDMLTRTNLILDILKEDISFFETIQQQLHKNPLIKETSYTEMLRLRRRNLFHMIEQHYPMWTLHQLETSKEITNFQSLMKQFNIFEPCYGDILFDRPRKSIKTEIKNPLFLGQTKRTGKDTKTESARSRLMNRMKTLEDKSLDNNNKPTSSTLKKHHNYAPVVPKLKPMRPTNLKLKSGDIEYRFIPVTQHSKDGGTACTSVSFASAVRMRDFETVESLTKEVDWDAVVSLGVRIWKRWRNASSSLGGFQTVYDLLTMKEIKVEIDRMSDVPEEYGGNIDGSIPHSMLLEADIDSVTQYRECYPSLKCSLEKMVQYGNKTVAVITVGIMSLSTCVYTHKQTLLRDDNDNNNNGDDDDDDKKEHDSTFVIFDSHSSKYHPGYSTLAIAKGVDNATSVIMELCSVTTTNVNRIPTSTGLKSNVPVGTQSTEGTYCICIFPQIKQ